MGLFMGPRPVRTKGRWYFCMKCLTLFEEKFTREYSPRGMTRCPNCNRGGCEIKRYYGENKRKFDAMIAQAQ